MKNFPRLFSFLLLALALAAAAPAQLPKNVQKASDGTHAITESLAFGSGKTGSFLAGSTLSIAGTLSGTPTGGTLNLSALTLTLPTTVSGGTSSFQPLDADLTSWAAVTRASGFDTFTATPSGANLASLLTTALPASKGGTGLTSLGTGVVTALGANINASGGVLTFGGATHSAPGTENVFGGNGSGSASVSSIRNTFWGWQVAPSVDSGIGRNSAFGYQPLYRMTTGAYNQAFGPAAMQYLTTGSDNIAMGAHAGDATNGDDNVFLGYYAADQSTGSRNVFIGGSVAHTQTSGNNNVIIGQGIEPTSATGSNQVNINGVFVKDSSVGVTVTAPDGLSHKLLNAGDGPSLWLAASTGGATSRDWGLKTNSIAYGDLVFYKSSAASSSPFSGSAVGRFDENLNFLWGTTTAISGVASGFKFSASGASIVPTTPSTGAFRLHDSTGDVGIGGGKIYVSDSLNIAILSGTTATYNLYGYGGDGGLYLSEAGGADRLKLAKTTGDLSALTGHFTTETVGKTLRVKSGSNALAGTVTLTAGAGTISSTAIDANTVIVLTLKTVGGTIGGQPYVDTITPATGATVTGGGASNTSTYNWVALKVN